MSIAKSLPPVDPFFMQECPFCGTKQRMMIKGNYVKDNKWERYPDIGYSFCNCKNIFFTKFENIKKPIGWNSLEKPLDELQKIYNTVESNQTIKLSMLDPYFINWNCPHEMLHWNCRSIYILWDKDSFTDEVSKIGFEIISSIRDMDVESKTPQNFHIVAKKL